MVGLAMHLKSASPEHYSCIRWQLKTLPSLFAATHRPEFIGVNTKRNYRQLGPAWSRKTTNL